MNQHTEVFETDDPNLAAVAMSIGGTVLPPDVDQLTGRLLFRFAKVPRDLEQRILNGAITVNAKDVLAALETLHRTLMRHKRARGLSPLGMAR